MRANAEGVWEVAEDFSGSGVGRDIVIGRLAVEEDIADATANEEGLAAVTLEGVADRIGKIAGVHGTIMRQGEGNQKAKK